MRVLIESGHYDHSVRLLFDSCRGVNVNNYTFISITLEDARALAALAHLITY